MPTFDEIFVTYCSAFGVRKVHLVFLLWLSFFCGKAQLLFLQDTYKGGITSDGTTYYNLDCLQADTINFQTHVAPGSTIRKAYLFSLRSNFYAGTTPKHDDPLAVNFNNTPITFDSSLILSPKYTGGNGQEQIMEVGKDVTQYTQLTGNKLIIPCQACLMNTDTSRHYIYIGFVLVIMYDNVSLLNVNAAIFLNDKNMGSSTTYSVNNLNPIINANDVGLSFWNDNTSSFPNYTAITYSLTTSQGTFRLGKLDQHYIGGWKKTLPGSFYYENNSLFGLADDTPDPFIDSTDALANIKSYISNNTTSFAIIDSLQPDIGIYGNCGLFLAYSTSCPSRSGQDTTLTYSICNGSNQTLNVSNTNAGNTYSWYASDGTLTSATSPSVAVSPTVSANYVAYIDSAGCKYTQHFKVLVNPVPKSDSLTKTDAICGDARGSATIKPPVNGGGPYTYNLGGLAQFSGIFTSLSPGVYSYTITNSFGCSYVKSNAITINEINPAIASFSFAPTVACLGQIVTFTSTSVGTNGQLWNFSMTDSSLTLNPTFVYTDTGYFNISLIAWHNQRQCSDTITKTIYIKECPPDSFSISPPNVFTPNNDEINDIWLPIIHEFGFSVGTYSLVIIDRWGIAVYKTSDINSGWDGYTTSGEKCSEGTYYYIIKYEANSNRGDKKSESLKGFLTLIR